jgi:predicted phage terminase large subunit-like protein
MIEGWKKMRQRARTDLLFLCQHVLGYEDVHALVHGPVIEKLQQFPGGEDVVNEDGLLVSYTPAVPVYELEGRRRRLFLDPRGFLKTTVITVAHTIQWIINYPDIRILIVHAVGEQAQKVLAEIKGHLQYNENFRWLFYEHCPPPKKASDFGNMQQFTTCARLKKWLKEPTVEATSIESTTAGTHMEVIKCTDIVDKENVRTPERIRQIKISFAQLQYLLDEPAKSWLDVEGTTYDFSDCYNMILDSELKKNENERLWGIHRRGALDSAGNPLWEKPVAGRTKCFDKKAIEAVRSDPMMDTYTFMAQYMNQCIAAADAYFDPTQFQWTKTELIKAVCRRYHATVDLATVDPLYGIKGTEDFTVLAVAGFDQMNRGYVCDLSRGRYKPDEVIAEIFRLYERWNCDFGIEDAAGARQIIPYLQREMAKRNTWPILRLIKRDTRISKQERIAGLQPWVRAGDLRFAQELPWKEELILEFARFPRYSHDDIVDAISDQMQNRSYFGPNKTREEMEQASNPWPFLGQPFEGFLPATTRTGVDKMTGM